MYEKFFMYSLLQPRANSKISPQASKNFMNMTMTSFPYSSPSSCRIVRSNAANLSLAS